MNENNYTKPLSLQRIKITDSFWKKEMELVRNEIIPYQWDALNDRVEGAAPSFCMRNFKVAGRQNRKRQEKGTEFIEPTYTFRGFEVLPEDENHLEEKFYGFVFQDSDFYKWIEAVAYSLTQHPDRALEELADEAIDIVCEAQQEDGYLDTYYIINGKDKIFSNLRDHHELYCLGHLIEGAVAYYEATGKRKLLEAACRYADYTECYFGKEENKCKGYPGHEIAEMALVRLYEVTGEKKYEKLSRFFIEERGKRPYYFDKEHPEAVEKNKEEQLRYEYHQAHMPVREQREAVGHAVRAVYLYSGMADMARLGNDKTLYDSCITLWNSIVNEKMYITGGIGGTHLGESFSFPFDLPNDTAYAETCASIGLIFFARRMLQIEPRAEYANVMERALYNTVLGGMAMDGKSFFYVNPLEVLPEACHKDERKFHVKPIRQKWFGCACCPPNLARLLGSIGSYSFTEKEDTLFVHLYTGCELEKEVAGETAKISITSSLPYRGDVSVQVKGTNKPFTVALRLPDWCSSYETAGLEASETWEKDGYLYVKKVWKDEDRVSLSFPMEVRFMRANKKVRENVNKVAVTRGPLVYCLEEADNGKDMHLLSVATHPVVSLEERQIRGETITGIVVEGKRQINKSSAKLYYTEDLSSFEKKELHFIPYYTWANRGENEMQVWVAR